MVFSDMDIVILLLCYIAVTVWQINKRLTPKNENSGADRLMTIMAVGITLVVWAVYVVIRYLVTHWK
jgi:hypothetical protein